MLGECRGDCFACEFEELVEEGVGEIGVGVAAGPAGNEIAHHDTVGGRVEHE